MNALNKLYATFSPESQITVEQRGACIETVLAQTLAFRLPLPSTPVEGLTRHYSELCSALVRNQVSAFNEGFPINTQQVIDLTFVIWKLRYSLVHPIQGVLKAGIVQAALTVEADDLVHQLTPRYKDVIGMTVPFDAETIIQDFVAKSFA
jgi:hypothetical protein